MPELPEVETIVQELISSSIIGLQVVDASVFWDRTLANLTNQAFCSQIVSQVILNIQRRGKFLIFTLTNDTLLVHLRMTGKFLLEDDTGEANSHERVRLYLSDQRQLRYLDQRKFGKWILTQSPDAYLDLLGLEPLSLTFTLQAFKACMVKNKKRIKAFLLDQRFIAGLGNIYVDEALWAAKIHPLRLIPTLGEDETLILYQSIINVLKKGLENTGTSLGDNKGNYFSLNGKKGGNQNSLAVFGRDGLLCMRCQTIIQKTVVAQRGTHFCPQCQLVEKL